MFNPSYLNIGEKGDVSFWQSIESPDMVDIVPNQMNPETGAYALGERVNAKILGVMMDYEAAGTTQVHEWSAPAPFNARGGYTTTWYHMDMRGWIDNTEKCVVLCLD